MKIIIYNVSSYKELIIQFLKITSCIKSVWLCLFFYILYDLFSFIYTSDKAYAMIKYVVILEMVSLVFLWLFYFLIKGEGCVKKDINLLLKSFIATELIISAIAILNYKVEIFPLLYYQRLSTCKDYNQFGTLILLGYSVGVWFFLKNEKTYWKKCIKLSLLAFFSLTVLYLVSSRRNFLLMIAVTVAFLIYLLVSDILIYQSSVLYKLKRLMLLSVFSGMVLFININVCEKVQQMFYERYLEEGRSSKEETVDDNMATIASGDFLKKRMYIWKIAVDEIQRFSIKELILGKGASYQSDVYDVQDNKESLMKVYHFKQEPGAHWMYPHNFLLSDMLSGGIFKVGLSLGIIFSIAYYLMKNFRIYFKDVLFLVMLFGIVYLNAFISYPFGYIGDKNYWLVLLIFICFNIYIAGKSNAVSNRGDKDEYMDR